MLFCVVLFSDACIEHHADCGGLCHLVGVGDISDHCVWIFCVPAIPRMAGDFGLVMIVGGVILVNTYAI